MAGNSVVSWPGAPLLPGGGSATCKITENLEKLSVGEANFYYCWNDGTWRFGIQIIVKTQVLGIGSAPQWEIMHDQNLQSPRMNWVGDIPFDKPTHKL